MRTQNLLTTLVVYTTKDVGTVLIVVDTHSHFWFLKFIAFSSISGIYTPKRRSINCCTWQSFHPVSLYGSDRLKASTKVFVSSSVLVDREDSKLHTGRKFYSALLVCCRTKRLVHACSNTSRCFGTEYRPYESKPLLLRCKKRTLSPSVSPVWRMGRCSRWYPYDEAWYLVFHLSRKHRRTLIWAYAWVSFQLLRSAYYDGRICSGLEEPCCTIKQTNDASLQMTMDSVKSDEEWYIFIIQF